MPARLTRVKFWLGEPFGRRSPRKTGFWNRESSGSSSLLRLQPICNCSSLLFLKITWSCLARKRTAVSVRFIRIPIALELRPVGANSRSLSSSACVHGREASSGPVIGPRTPRVEANQTRQISPSRRRSNWLPPDRSAQGSYQSNGQRRSKARSPARWLTLSERRIPEQSLCRSSRISL
jgi:hypothetical protein